MPTLTPSRAVPLNLTLAEHVAIASFLRDWRQHLTRDTYPDVAYIRTANERAGRFEIVRQILNRSRQWRERFDAIETPADFDAVLALLLPAGVAEAE